MDDKSYFNPYYDQNFFGFFLQLFFRLGAFLRGDLSLADLAADEVQIVALVGVAISTACVGSFLVLRRMTMLANALSHTILLGIVAAYFFFHIGSSNDDHFHHSYTGFVDIRLMLLAALAMGFITAFLTEFLTKVAKLQEDASTGLVFTTLFALGVILVTLLTRSAHVGTEVVMGNVDALYLEDCKLVFVILGINLFSFFLFFKEFKITTFDSGLAQALGISPLFFNYLLMAQVSATVVGAFRAVGVIMVLAFITGPPLAARLLTDHLRRMLWLAALLGSIASVLGVAFARHVLTVYGIALSTGGLVVCFIAAIYLAVLLFAPQYGLVSKWRQRLRYS